eukprot:TRINITY_DN438_c1_g1_i1.p1 TRINITY_DN438_c1_g1~~TRINITY_DN438_c1_g1_i1.p1  ORF type:complete len:272 (+),score=51.62 TRINITY_DN438_c1_g1_i1:75-890(+)
MTTTTANRTEPLFTQEQYVMEPVSLGLAKAFGGLNGSVPYACQVVEKVHSRGGKDLRVVMVQKFTPKSTGAAEAALFLCTMDGRVKRVMKVSDMIGMSVMAVEEGAGLFSSSKTEVLQVLIKHDKEQDMLLNLIHHKLNSPRATYRILDVLNFLWKESKNTSKDLPLQDYRITPPVGRDLRAHYQDSSQKDTSVKDRLHEWTRPGASTGSMERTVGHEEMDYTYGGERLEHLLETGQTMKNPPVPQGDTADADNDDVDDVEAALRAFETAS